MVLSHPKNNFNLSYMSCYRVLSYIWFSSVNLLHIFFLGRDVSFDCTHCISNTRSIRWISCSSHTASRPILISATVTLKSLLTPFLLGVSDGVCAPIAYRFVQRDLPPPLCSFSTVNVNNTKSWTTMGDGFICRS